MKSLFKKALLVSLLALPLFACDSNTDESSSAERTSELEPISAEIADKHAAVATLGTAVKATKDQGDFSLLASSTKDLSITYNESIHNSLTNVDSVNNLTTVASAVTADLRVLTNEGGDPQISLAANATSLNWNVENASGKVQRTRSNVAASAFVKDKTYYIDPSNKELAGLIYDVADYLGYGDYRTIISAITANKYYVAESDIESIISIFDDDAEEGETTPEGSEGSEESSFDYTKYFTDDAIDDFIVKLDGKVEHWGWLTSYTDANGDTTLYASMSKADLIAFAKEMDEDNDGGEYSGPTDASNDSGNSDDSAAITSDDSSQSIDDQLANLNVTSLEFYVTYNANGLKSAGTVFALTNSEKSVPAYEEEEIPLGDDDSITNKKQIGYKDTYTDVSGGFSVAFGKDAPASPAESGWTNLLDVLGSLIPSDK